ncbi:MAG: hypothetical protein SFU86_08485 [Pirellulaceae bacterium]|nr:hypothetical protein [Pirellulaceae bacterium]
MLIGLLASSVAANGPDCCAGCGCQCACRKVCRLVCETKKVPKTTYSCQCEDFCLPGKSKHCGTICEPGCEGCPQCKPHYVPQSGGLHTRTKLVKTITEKEEKVYRWVVEYCCDKCAASPSPSASAAPTPAPVVPASWQQALRPISAIFSR